MAIFNFFHVGVHRLFCKQREVARCVYELTFHVKPDAVEAEGHF